MKEVRQKSVRVCERNRQKQNDNVSEKWSK